MTLTFAAATLVLAQARQGTTAPAHLSYFGTLVAVRTEGNWRSVPENFKPVTTPTPFFGMGIGEAKPGFRTTGITLSSSGHWMLDGSNVPSHAMVSNARPTFPRRVRTGSTTIPEYQKIASDYLKGKGFNQPAKIQRLWRTDLDGDRSDETLIEMSNSQGAYLSESIQGGFYNCVLLIHLDSAGRRQVASLGETIRKKDEYWIFYAVEAIADIDGDGIMEVMVRDEMHEGLGLTLYRLARGRLTKLAQGGYGV
ncbi:MAG: hypothetical protein MUC92_12100 [Fimbriimonadaceae bacterium]|jgi:hypothetical protein|nr:hypothetical protein [Fimbriimonadaceae bacterium]